MGLRKLLTKNFIKMTEDSDHHGESYPAIVLTDQGWGWIEANESRFILTHETKESKLQQMDDDIPF